MAIFLKNVNLSYLYHIFIVIPGVFLFISSAYRLRRNNCVSGWVGCFHKNSFKPQKFWATSSPRSFPGSKTFRVKIKNKKFRRIVHELENDRLLKIWSLRTLTRRALNSHASGMALARLNGFEIVFVRNPIFESGSWFFVISFKFIWTPIFEIKIHARKSLDIKKVFFEDRFS